MSVPLLGDPRQALSWDTRRVFLCLALLLASTSVLIGRSNSFSDSWRWVRFDTSYGLPSNSVHDLVETPAGTVWAATEVGVAWYDGYSWHAMGPDRGLPSMRPWSVATVGNDGVLVAIGDRLYQGTEKGFSLVPLESKHGPLAVTSAVAITPDRFLILDGSVLHEYSNGAVESFHTKSDAPMHQVQGIWKTRAGNIWLNTRKGLYRWELGDWVQKLPYPSSHIEFQVLTENRNGVALAAAAGPRAAFGLWQWQGLGPPAVGISGDAMFRAADIGSDGNAVAVDLTGSVKVREGRNWSTLSPAPSPLEGASFVRFRNNGDLWVGTVNGLYLYRSSSTRWTVWKSGREGARNMVNGILQARDGSIWIATGTGIGVHRPNGELKWAFRGATENPLCVTGLNEDEQGRIWASSGSDFDGAYRFDGLTWRHFGQIEGLPATRIHKIQKDRRGRLWFLGLSGPSQQPESAQTQSGVFVYSQGRFTRWDADHGLPNGRVYCFAEGEDGAYWFGSTSGLSRWKTGKWTHWRVGTETKSWVFTLAIDRQNRVWFGDRRYGLGVVENDKVRYLTTEDGLVNDAIWDLKVDSKGTLWIATYGGLGCYQNGIWSKFVAGLTNLNLWPLLPADDHVYIGTAAGLNILGLDESRLPGPRVSPSPASILGNAAELRWQVFPYWGEVPAQEVETRFRLDDENWSAWSTQRGISHLHLKSGRHTFRVQAKSLFGSLDNGDSGVTFEIPYPRYRQVSFLAPVGLLLAALLVLGSAYVIRRRRHEVQLRRSEEQYRAILRTTLDGFWIVDLQGRLLEVNDAYCRLTGYTRDELLGKTFVDVEAMEDETEIAQRIERLIETGSSRFETRHRSKDGRLIEVEVSTTYLPSEAKVFAFLRDITERNQAEETLRESEERYRRIIETAQEGIWVIGEDGLVTYVNDRLASMLGHSRDAILGHPVDDFIDLEFHETARGNRERRKLGLKEQYLFTFRRKDGSPLHTIVSSNPLFDKQGNFLGSLGMLTDITERTLAEKDRAKLEEQLRQAQKMESVGRLAGGVAHDFNNLLTVINGYSELLLKALRQEDPARANVEQIRMAGERAANLTQQLLAFSRKQIIQPIPLSLNTVVTDAEKLLRRVVGEDIELVTRLTPAIWPIMADPSQIHQVLMNLAVNARDAMPKGGKLAIETDMIESTAEDTARNPDAAPGSYAVLAVSDTGFGMDEDTLKNIFEPFFTTKEKGKGTGLGLSTVYGIVRQGGGWISVVSKPGVGSTFKIYLPRIEEPALRHDSAGHTDIPSRGGETVLVVEDQDELRMLAVTILRTHGYRVLDACNGREALDLIERHAGRIHAMVTDVVMPGMTGRELADHVKMRRPELKVLFVSGYAEEDVIAPGGLLEEDFAFLQKPFTPDTLAAKLREVLGPASLRDGD
jgi:PAS domain S-box-containing protein